MGSGKSSAAKYLSSKYAFQYTRYSKILEEWLRPDSSDPDRLQKLGWEVMDGGRQGELNSRLISHLDHSRSAAIDGLRHRIDYDSLSSAFRPSFYMIFIQAPQELRFRRLVGRFSDFTAFQLADKHPVEANIDSLGPLASATITHDGTLEELYRRLDAWIATSSIGEKK